MAEDDYKYSVDIACNSDDKAYREWAINVKSNEYCVSTPRAVRSCQHFKKIMLASLVFGPGGKL